MKLKFSPVRPAPKPEATDAPDAPARRPRFCPTAKQDIALAQSSIDLLTERHGGTIAPGSADRCREKTAARLRYLRHRRREGDLAGELDRRG